MTAQVRKASRATASAIGAVVCWLAIVGITVSVFHRVSSWDGPGTSWFAFTLGEALVVAVALGVAMSDVRRTAVAHSPGRPRAWIPLTLAAVILLLGGLLNTILFLTQHSDACGGSSGLISFECTHEPGPIFKTAGVVSVVLSFAAFAGIARTARRAPIALWLSPAIILGFDVLAWLLWAPHHGFGITPHNHVG